MTQRRGLYCIDRTRFSKGRSCAARTAGEFEGEKQASSMHMHMYMCLCIWRGSTSCLKRQFGVSPARDAWPQPRRRMRTSLWSMASTPASYATRSSRLASVTSFRRWSKGSSRCARDCGAAFDRPARAQLALRALSKGLWGIVVTAWASLGYRLDAAWAPLGHSWGIGWAPRVRRLGTAWALQGRRLGTADPTLTPM